MMALDREHVVKWVHSICKKNHYFKTSIAMCSLFLAWQSTKYLNHSTSRIRTGYIDERKVINL